MEPQTQTPGGVSAPPTGASTPTYNDPQVALQAKNLTKAIFQTESGGDYNAKGKSGESGAGQWIPDTWKSQAQDVLGDSNAQMTPQNQSVVAQGTIRKLIGQGKNAAQIAAIWNSGTDQNWQNKVGTNKQGVQYNVPKYVKSVTDAYQTLKGGGQVQADPNNPSSVASTQNANVQPQGNQDLGTQALNVAKGVTNFALPIIGDLYHDIQGKSDKSFLQQAGDAGMSALWFLPFGDIAEGLGMGAKALGLGEKAAQATGVLGTGLATGYAGDVSSNLAQGKTGGEAATPGLGTVVGGGLGAAGLGAGALYNKFVGEQNVVNRIQGAYEDASGATKSGIKGASKTVSKGLEPNAEFLANAGIPPETQEINGRRVFTTGVDSASQKTLQERATALTNLRDQGIAQSGATTNFEQMRQGFLSQAEKDFSGTQLDAAKLHLNKEMDALSVDPKYPQDPNGNVSLADASKIKSYFQGNSNYDATRPSFISQTNGTAAKVAKGIVESGAETAGSPSIKVLNKLIQQHIDAIGYLNKLNGQTIKGGRIGKYLYEGVGAAAGSGVANALGGGLIGNIAGPIAGAYAGGKVSDFMQRLAAGGPMSAATLGRMATKDPQIVQQFLEYIGSKGEKIAPMVQPLQRRAGGAFAGLLKRNPVKSSAIGAGLIRLAR